MAIKKSSVTPRRPTLGDVLAKSPDIPDRAPPPAELNAVQNLFVFDRFIPAGAAAERMPSRRKPSPEHADLTGAIFGRVCAPLQAIPVPKPSKGAPKSSEPFIPEWSGTSFVPRSAGLPSRPIRRRRNGARVRPEYVFPPDGRRVYYPNSYPWRVIGQVFVWEDAAAPSWTWAGSAALVGRNVILTASHMVPWGSRNCKALFVPAYYDGQSVYGPNAASWVVSAIGYDNHSQGDDMAVMRLEQPLGEWLGYFGYKTYDDDWEDGNYWTLAGYPGDIANAQRPSASYWFPITDDDSDGMGVELEYQADTSEGNSGGPVFGWWGGKPYVIGTHSGGEDAFGEPKQNVAAGGVALSSLIAWARSNW